LVRGRADSSIPRLSDPSSGQAWGFGPCLIQGSKWYSLMGSTSGCLKMTLSEGKKYRTPMFFLYLALLLTTAVGLELYVLIGIRILNAKPDEIMLVCGLTGSLSWAIILYALRKIKREGQFGTWQELRPYEKLVLVVGLIFYAWIAVSLFRTVYPSFISKM
ncbi:MAG: hypothetical protein NC910_04390, partial [Candidatus Omnitrophica bacterium]|nr:hypothetical protein [Candidatus Omnitrophota bacterium]